MIIIGSPIDREVRDALSAGRAQGPACPELRLGSYLLRMAAGSYLRVLDGRARYGGKSTPKTWFFSVIRHVANEMQRTRSRRTLLNLRIFSTGQGEEEFGADSPSYTPDQLAQHGQSSSQLRCALLQLPLRQREVLHLVFYAGCTLQESANTLQVSLGSVRTHYHRGKERLAELLHLEGYDEHGQ